MKLFVTFFLMAGLLYSANAIDSTKTFVSPNKQEGYFQLMSKKAGASLLIDSNDYHGAIRALDDLKNDIYKVTGFEPKLLKNNNIPKGKNVVIVGTLGKSKYIDQLVDQNVINPGELSGKWEKYIIKTVENPLPGIENALVIAGSDKRGTIYGIYEVSEQIGVSPWYWWADVPVKKKENIYIKPGTYTDGEPAVKYRGIFINDEAPAFRNWAFETFGGQDHKCYETIFELLLRNKANFLWPAMWIPTMFNVDDTLNPTTADDYGIVMSTSHHEPMMRAHNEWYKFGSGEWNYETNKENLQDFWREGIERMGDNESVVTMGMRGDGDEAMSEETAVGLLKEIINDQRDIITEVTGKPAEETPQVWAVYKEVQDYYDKGMQVDDDIMILLCDDNWGNVRILPKEENVNHPGGYGMYYHFDYVGGPVSYRWLNTIQIERIWEQMKLTYEYGVKDLWLVNVGDLKPMELPISFFLDYAWNPDAIQAEDLPDYYTNWAEQQFGAKHANEIAQLLALYTKYNARRTPEMLKPETYSIENYREADRVIEEYNSLAQRSNAVYFTLPENYKSAYYQLVHSPILLCSNLNQMYVAAGKNSYYAEMGASAANYYADKVKELFEKDAELTRFYHEDLENGKWNHMMSQIHIGYTSWNQPSSNTMPSISYVKPPIPAQLGYRLEYSQLPQWDWLDAQPNGSFNNSLPPFDPINRQSYLVDIFNRGQEELSFTIQPEEDWIMLTKSQGNIQYHEQVAVSIDWERAPKENTIGKITISGIDSQYQVAIPLRVDVPEAFGFIENNGVIAMEAINYLNSSNTDQFTWTSVPNLGRTHSSLIIEPVTAVSLKLTDESPMVEYEFTVFDSGRITIETFLSPTQDFKKQGGLKFAIAVDDEEPQIINMNEGEDIPDWKYPNWWSQSVGDHIKINTSEHRTNKPGPHTLKIWMIDPGIVFQKFVINAGGKRASYLGPPESKFVK